MKIMEYVKSHPWMIGAIVVIGGLVFFAIAAGGGGGGSAASTSDQPSDAQIAANAAISAAQIQAQAQTAAASYNYQTAVLGANVQSHSDELEAATTQKALDVQQALGLAQIDADKALGTAQIAANQQIAQTAYNAQVQTQQIIAKSKKTGGILGAIGSIFSDIRMKENIEFVGVEKGYNIYEYNYIGDNERVRGVMAQEILNIKPDAVSIHESGYYMVNYDRL